MIKVQQFFMKYKRYILLINTVLLLFAEVSKLLLHMDIPYQVLMFIVGTIGVIPIALTAISSLRVRLVSIDVLVSLAVIGAFIIGEFNEDARRCVGRDNSKENAVGRFRFNSNGAQDRVSCSR